MYVDIILLCTVTVGHTVIQHRTRQLRTGDFVPTCETQRGGNSIKTEQFDQSKTAEKSEYQSRFTRMMTSLYSQTSYQYMPRYTKT